MFDFLMVIIPIIAMAILVIVILSFASPKFGGKIMSRQVKSMKYMLDESKNDLTDLAGTTIDIKKNILDKNEEVLRELKTRGANISKDSIEITAKAIKDGLTSTDNIYCKHCGASIDKDSKFCKECGKNV